MGYVPAGPVPAEGQDHELPRRQHRRARAGNRALANRRVARLGEELAARYLADRGAVIVGRNVRSGRGEIDILARFSDGLVAVEVKTRVGAGDPREAYSREKSDHVWDTVARLRPRPSRVDLVAVSLTAAGVDLRWIPGVS